MSSPISLTIKDETFGGSVLNEVLVNFNSRKISIRELIEARVRNEVDTYNKKPLEYFKGLIDPMDSEKTINGVKIPNRKHIDAEKQVYVALNAFQKNGFFVVVDNEQCTSLDQDVTLNDDTRISFIKLTPLVGG
jgi:hypothetical protein